MRRADRLARSLVRIEFFAEGFCDRCIGIVIRRSPLLVLVPMHAAQTVEDGTVDRVEINGSPFRAVDPVVDAHLATDQVALLHLDDGREQVHDLSAIPSIPRSAGEVSPGDTVSVCCVEDESGSEPRRFGRVLSVRRDLVNGSVLAGIQIRPGQSGSPMLRKGKLFAIVQGQQRGPEGQTQVVGIPLSEGSLRSLRIHAGIERRVRIRRSLAVAGVISVCLGLLLILGAWEYPIDGFELLEDERTLLIRRNALFPAPSSIAYMAESRIWAVQPISTNGDGDVDRICVGTETDQQARGRLSVIDAHGHLVWEYAVPDGECIYPVEEEAGDGFTTTHIYPADLDVDGQDELIAAFAHRTWYPAKIMVFELDGQIIGEYWHRGYVRTLVSGQTEPGAVPITVFSVSNNSLKSSWWNPQALVAFRGTDIAGRGPEPGAWESVGSHVWYWVIENMDPEVHRAKAYGLALVDQDRDGIMEIRASLTDGRFYYLSADGEVVAKTASDEYARDYGETPVLDLLRVEDYLGTWSPPEEG